MVSYLVGVLFGILGGVSNFTGQVLQKKAINDLPPEVRASNIMKSLVRSGTWLTGMVFVMAFTAIFQLLALANIGPALVPGLMASGFIVLAIGSVKILNEKLKTPEIFAIFILIIAIFLIGLSNLTITSKIENFTDSGFVTRIIIFSIIFVGLWLGLYFTGKRVKKFNSIFLALGTGFPFAVGNLWMQPMLITLGPAISGNGTSLTWPVLLVSVFFVVFGNLLGIIHYQYALNAGNAAIVVPVQQTPQQIVPILIFYAIYQLPSPTTYSLLFIIIGVSLIIVAAFILAKRQVSLDNIK